VQDDEGFPSYLLNRAIKTWIENAGFDDGF